MSESIEVRRNGSLVLAAAAPSMLGLVVSDRSPRTIASVAHSDRNVLAAIDGPMFSVIRGAGDGAGNAAYRTYRRGRLDYAHIDRGKGIDAPTRYPERGLTISVAGDRAYANRGARVQAGASVAVQGYPSMVWQGTNEGSTRNDLDRNERSAFGILRDGRVFIAFAETGIRAMAESLIAMGAEYATYGDGGGSGGMFVRSQPGGPLSVDIKTSGRRIVSFVTLEQRGAASNAVNRAKGIINGIASSVGIEGEVGDVGAVATIVTIGGFAALTAYAARKW